MKTLIGYLVFSAILALPGDTVISAEKIFQEQGGTTAEITNPGSLLWEISGNGMEKPSYLFGTLHLICPEKFSFPETWKTSFEKTEQLILEIDFSDPGLMQQFQKGMMMEGGKSIQDFLSTGDLQFLEDFLADSLMMDINQVRMIMPMILSSFFYSHLLECQPMSYDLFLMEEAIINGYKINGLETVNDQLSVFKTISYDEQALLLMDMIKDYDQTRKLYNRMAELYIDQNLDGLYELILLESKGIPDFDETFLVQRNRNWIPEIERFIFAKPAFIAVGAGHLPGDEGLVRLLQEQGYDMRPVIPE